MRLAGTLYSAHNNLPYHQTYILFRLSTSGTRFYKRGMTRCFIVSAQKLCLLNWSLYNLTLQVQNTMVSLLLMISSQWVVLGLNEAWRRWTGGAVDHGGRQGLVSSATRHAWRVLIAEAFGLLKMKACVTRSWSIFLPCNTNRIGNYCRRSTYCLQMPSYQWPFLLTWINFNPSMDN